jgi:beta-lactamase regulating signal transducer with metallopeptidase domain
VQAGSGIAIRPFEAAVLLWLCVALGLTVAAAAQWVRFRVRLRRGRHVTDKAVLEVLADCVAGLGVGAAPSVVEFAHIKSPALFGLIHPTLLLPAGATSRLNADELRFVFLHELSHLKRRDIAVNWLVSALQFAHWFNPLLWYAFYRMRADRELACDSLALSHVGRAETDGYGRTLVSLVSGIERAPRLAGTVGILESGSQLKRRIAMIKAFRQGSYKWSLPAVLVVLALAAVTLTNAETATPTKGGTGEQTAPTSATEPSEGKIVSAVVTVSKSTKTTDDKGNVVYTEEGTTTDIDPQVAEVEKKLRKRLEHFEFVDAPFASVIDFLRNTADINIVVDPAAAPAQNANAVTLQVTNATVKSILDLITVQQGINWDIVDNFVYISDEAGIAILHNQGPLKYSALWDADVWITPKDITVFDGDYCRFLGATIHSKGKGSIPQVSASFYLGDPDKGGKLIGEGGLGMKAGATATEAIPWDAAPGKYEIFVVLDREKKVDEAERSNNRASATITIEAPFKLKDQGGEKK